MTHEYIILSNNKLLVRVRSVDIAYVTSDGSYSTMVLTGGKKHVFSFNLSAFEKLLEAQLGTGAQVFIRLGKSLIINSAYIYCINITQQTVTLSVPDAEREFELTASLDALKALKKLIENNINRRLRI